MSADPGNGTGTYADLASARRGLSSEAAANRLAADGPNKLPETKRDPAWKRFSSELVHFYAFLFWIAGALAFIAGLPQLGVAILVVIFLNGAFAFAQEEKAVRAADRLRNLLPVQVSVVRDGMARPVKAEDVVVGDAVVLEAGDRVPADLELFDVTSLAIDTSTLTGESVPAHPSQGDVIYAGCFVVEGDGRALVVATGTRTQLADIAMLTSGRKPPPTPLRRELDRSSRRIAAIAVGVGIAFLAVGLLVGMPVSDGFVFAIGVTVAVVPCGLLPTVTLSLANGAQQMAKQQALVRHLEAVETLGSTTFICTDKTGTLTRNEMAAVEVWMPAGTAEIAGIGYEPTATISFERAGLELALREVARAASRCSTGSAMEIDGHWVARGDPMEAAIDALARRAGFDREADSREVAETRRYPFDARRRRMSVVVGDRLLVKGAPDAIISRCEPSPSATEALHAMTGRGLRVLAVATKVIDPDFVQSSPDEVERDLTLLGLIALEDPPREGAAESVEACRRAGIKVAMVTGDHPRTALAIACEIGLADTNVTVIEGTDLPSDLDELGVLVDHDGAVVARVDPEDKLRIAQALRKRSHVVAMTGDGVNDAPALREADIGVAMGKSGTDVAREAADLVLLDDHFATIVSAIKQGRATFSNIRRFLTYHLTDNVAELAPFVVWALSARRFPLAIGVLQVLALDIGTDILPALALGAEPPPEHVLEQPPIRRHLLDRNLFMRSFGVLGPVEAMVELAAFVATFIAIGWRPGEIFPQGDIVLAASGAAFSAVVFGQVANAFACRSTIRPIWEVGWRSNPLLLWAIGAELIMLAAFLYVAPVASVLGHAGPTEAGFGIALLAIPAVVLADTLQKSVARRRLAT